MSQKDQLEERRIAAEEKAEKRTVAGRRRLSLRDLPPRERAYATLGVKLDESGKLPRDLAGFFEDSDEKAIGELQARGCPVVGIFRIGEKKHVIFAGADPRKQPEPERPGKGK